MFHYRDSKPGRFYLDDHLPAAVSDVPAFMRFARSHGAALSLWSGEADGISAMLRKANLDWSVEAREVLVPTRYGEDQLTQAHGYQALVRPDTEEVLSVVTTIYSVAENAWVGEALQSLSARLGARQPVIAAASFGRNGERTMFAGRVTEDEHKALCLIAYNTHGGEGAVRFQLVEADRVTGATCVLGSSHASMSISHVGNVEEKLLTASSPDLKETFIERYLSETGPLWAQLADRLWTPRHTAALIRELWDETPRLAMPPREDHTRHPGHHLPGTMSRITDAASAYREVCAWIDNRSEACERGDFTKDRDERLALGAGNRHKRHAWNWIVHNT